MQLEYYHNLFNLLVITQCRCRSCSQGKSTDYVWSRTSAISNSGNWISALSRFLLFLVCYLRLCGFISLTENLLIPNLQLIFLPKARTFFL